MIALEALPRPRPRLGTLRQSELCKVVEELSAARSLGQAHRRSDAASAITPEQRRAVQFMERTTRRIAIFLGQWLQPA
ncbi:hypothetical protein HYQ46_007224 [Verticillium longisporum]|nr:hypothetical protein HYQ46_007224 [Verticillium longisporum]